MNEADEFDTFSLQTENASKRKIQKDTWKKSKEAKKKREEWNAGCIIKCRNTEENAICKVRSLPLQSLKDLNVEFNSIGKAVERRAYRHKFISVTHLWTAVSVQMRSNYEEKKRNNLSSVPFWILMMDL